MKEKLKQLKPIQNLMVLALLVLLSILTTQTSAIAQNYASLPQTGQTQSYASGDDGDLQMGVQWPDPRFTDNSDGTVTDNLTGLIWLKNANCIMTEYPSFDSDGGVDGRVTWQNALNFIAGINDGTYVNCGAGYFDWRLPNVRELQSLIHFGFSEPAVPDTAGTGQWSEGDPFTGVQPDNYWQSTTLVYNPDTAFSVYMGNGAMSTYGKAYSTYVWPVRDMQNINGGGGSTSCFIVTAAR